MSVRVGFLGNDAWSVPSLEAMAGEPDVDIAIVVTNPPRPAGRGSALTPTPVADAARRLHLPLVELDGMRTGEGPRRLREAAPDALTVVAYGELLTPEVLEIAPLGAINVHFSLLPRWRGAAPVQHALLAGDERTGVTVMRMDAGLDTGPVLNQLEEAIRPEDDAGSLGGRLARLGGMMLVAVVRRLAEGGQLPERHQDPSGVTLAPKPGPDLRRIRWESSAVDIVRLVRAMAPEPGALAMFRDAPVKVLAAGVTHDDLPAGTAPGTVVTWDDRGVLVAAGTGGVHLTEVAPAGRKRMEASAWARGARFEPDERLV